MQLGQLIQIANGRWAGIFGGIAGVTAATVVPQLSTVSSGRVALLSVLVFVVAFLLSVVVANLVGVMPRDAQGGKTASDD